MFRINNQQQLSSITSFNSGSSVSADGLSKANTIPCIWTNKVNATKTNKSEDSQDDQKIVQKIISEQNRLSKTYNVKKQFTQAQNLEKALKRSDFCLVASTAKNTIKEIMEDKIPEILGSIADRCADCKTEDEVKNVIKDIEAELMQQKHIANVYTMRTQKAQELDNKLSKLDEDTRKKIDTSKLVDELTKTPEQVDIGNVNNDTENSDTNISAKFDEALKNDEITQITDKLINYIESGEKDEALKDYIKNDSSENSKSNLHPNLNLFSTQKNKNPFLH